MNLCKHCRYYEAAPHSTETNNYDRCLRPQPSPGLSLVTGRPLPPEPAYCDLERGYYAPTACGPDAVYFEDAEPRYEREIGFARKTEDEMAADDAGVSRFGPL